MPRRSIFASRSRTIAYCVFPPLQAWWKCLLALFAPAHPQLCMLVVTISPLATRSKRASFPIPTRFGPTSRGCFLRRLGAPKISSSASSSAKIPTVVTDPTLILRATNFPSARTCLRAKEHLHAHQGGKGA